MTNFFKRLPFWFQVCFWCAFTLLGILILAYLSIGGPGTRRWVDAANRAGEKSIPADIVSGMPMGYRKTADGQYALWCFGFDGVDHGGKRVLDAQDPARTKFSAPEYTGDWVWDFPGK